jgi:large conductance mechanosensitive channel
MFAEFKKFIMRGNVVDMAVGVIIAGAFGAIVSSLVSDILMPPIATISGGIDFKDKSIDLPGSKADSDGKKDAEGNPIKVPVQWRYGAFIQKVIDFLIIGFCLFLVVKAMNKVQKKKEENPSLLSASEKLLVEIRDILKNQTK